MPLLVSILVTDTCCRLDIFYSFGRFSQFLAGFPRRGRTGTFGGDWGVWSVCPLHVEAGPRPVARWHHCIENFIRAEGSGMGSKGDANLVVMSLSSPIWLNQSGSNFKGLVLGMGENVLEKEFFGKIER